MKLKKLNNSYYSLYDSDGDIVASNNPNTPCSKRLSKQNCDTIFGVVDIKKLADVDFTNEIGEGPTTNTDINSMVRKSHLNGAEFGFNKAMELNKDKLFTVEDIMKAFEAGYETLESEKTYNEHYDILIQSLQQPKEIEVEVKPTSVGHCNCPCHRYNNMTHFSPCCYPKQVYKLDENDCLILKKK